MVKLDDRWAPEPDVIFYTKERKGMIKSTFFDGAPNIVVEILSPSSNREDDINEKLPKYLEHNVDEVWIVDPEEQSVVIHTDNEGERFDISNQQIESQNIPEIRFDLSWIFDPDISMVDIIKKLDL